MHFISHKKSGTIVTDTTDKMNDITQSLSNKYPHTSTSILMCDYHSAYLHQYTSSSLAKNDNNKDDCSKGVFESKTRKIPLSSNMKI